MQRIRVIDKINREQYIFTPIDEKITNNERIYICKEVTKKKRVGRPLDTKSKYLHKKYQFKIKLDDYEKIYPTLTIASKDENLINKGINYTVLLNVSRGAIKHKWKNLTVEKINID